MEEQSFGEKRIGVSRNYDKNPMLVNDIKEKVAELIDLLESNLRDDDKESSRLVDLAQDHLEIAAMFAVKAAFI